MALLAMRERLVVVARACLSAEWMSGALLSLLLVLVWVLPQLNFLRYDPVADWWTQALVVLAAGVSALAVAGRGGRVAPAAICLLALVLLLSVANAFIHRGPSISLDAVAALLAVALLVQGLRILHDRVGREVFVRRLAVVVLCSALLQVLIGFAQALGLAPLAHGWLMFDQDNVSGNIMGNIAQRNLYAQFLGWGMVAGCYLYAIGRLKPLLFMAVTLSLTLLMAWSGARLVLAYGLACALLAWWWLRCAPASAPVLRMSRALALAVILIALTQLFNHQIVECLNWLGLPLQVQSGSDRILDAGFGARRRIEWSKAWLVFQAHPWFGVGVGGFAAQTVALEAFAGFPKVPESWLFTQSHNLIFQLLAETGLAGTVLVLGGLLSCLWPYFKRGAQSVENIFLVSIAMMVLGHSMFEFPFWYLPFLAGLALVCALSPLPTLAVRVRPSLLRLIAAGVGLACIAYFVTGVPIFWKLAYFNVPSPRVEENIARIKQLNSISHNPFWVWDADGVLANYLIPDREQLPLKLAHFERLAIYRPYPMVLLKLSVLRALDAQPAAAQQALVMAIASFPDAVPSFVTLLASQRAAEVQPLLRIARQAQQAYVSHGSKTDAGRLAAVMSVAAPVTRQPIF